VVKRDAEIDDRITGEIAALRSLDDAFFDSRYVVIGNRATENLVYEFEIGAARQRVHLDLAVTVLAMPTRLFFVAALHVGVAADGFAIRHLRSFEHNFGVVALLEL